MVSVCVPYVHALNRTSLCRSPLGSALGLTRQAGELVAVAYSSPKTGYKNPNAYGARPVFNGETYVHRCAALHAGLNPRSLHSSEV